MGFMDRVERNLEGLTAVSTGPCPGCEECADRFGFDTVEEFDGVLEAGGVPSEGSFSSRGCGICDSTLGGNLEVWHGVDSDGKIMHFNDACVDCVVFLANGELPEGEEPEEPEPPRAPFFPA